MSFSTTQEAKDFRDKINSESKFNRKGEADDYISTETRARMNDHIERRELAKIEKDHGYE